ncbi:hypothetical protein [Dolichospermum circinale]|uniref:hypothetical protein n=1 Tax=Dolichospermum circinale TaxID=109265 RepID=UPI00232DCE06|nr:hypothetical protein [Dolichospermum circinale]MDB9452656.1 hypothetical protein [Dolichospermum circinale CS-547]
MNQQSRNNKNKEQENLKNITCNGFNIEETSDKNVDLAFLSLKIALKAYFSTYHCYDCGQFYFRDLITDDSHKICDVFGGKLILSKYCEAYTECIIHFHHFAELVLKNFLRHDNPLLVDYPANDKNKNATVLKYKMIKGELSLNELSFEDENHWKTISFSEALQALLDLIQADKESKIKNDYYQKLSFIVPYKAILEKLNSLRNKVWHRGLYILNYEALDEVIGRYILRFVDEVINHKNYLGHKDLWSYEELDCGIEPIKEIINHFQEVKEGKSYNIEKIAFLKELGRASYNVNIPWLQHQSSIENKAIIVTNGDYSRICRCPVCGVNSLIIYIEEDYERNPYSGEILRVLSSYPAHVRCECCSFELHHEIGNASEYGIEGIRDFWV